MTTGTNTLELPAEAGSVALARRFVAERLLGRCPPALVDDVTLVTSELATNAILHAASSFGVTLRNDDGQVILEIRDRSRRGPVPSDQTMLGTHGRGLAIVTALARDWGVTLDPAGGKAVWASFDA